jgi:hypothetical protein
MAFETEADLTNAVAGALSVLLRNHLPGGKPVLIVTANKSLTGKDTVIDCAAETSGSISYQAPNWAVEQDFVGAVKNPTSITGTSAPNWLPAHTTRSRRRRIEVMSEGRSLAGVGRDFVNQ